MIVAIVAPLVALAVFVAVALFSPVMSVRTIEVEGLDRLDEATVHQALADLEGRPLALVGSGDIAERLAPFVLVQSYSTRAEPPSTLVVEVIERQAIGALPNGGGFTVYDAAGIALWDAATAPMDVPSLELRGGDPGSDAFASAAEVSLALPSAFRSQVATIEAASLDDVTLELRDGTSVVWGSADESTKKVEVLLALIAATSDAPPSQYDVSSPEAPVTR
ncbi:FtsQ-type POTRA domain-containing protein [Pseudoclavibacter endophyticus]|uniref:FtsQ-type POTRA domain-containing protein n=1 Tax=Pseudoclavibacter endophyticus TaxID=1778590 RepID=A0A6H9WQ36_9MICO|nr:FtsQ-type POTRA domain-containing protein [Pseudoclavibacter endophyticus]KAB1650248.1 FtsQ-type POTRA domain-containing protein [Pseudoclavibacter endophyticus]